ncbi:MAG: putative drug exporter of the superfamily [Solirubrobacterales bacterium]|nr:putative drug exporter of the superfamily [Solirubrobacterales bacterium]
MLIVAALILVALGAIGSNVESRLDPTTLNIPGTESSRSNELLREHFGATMPFAILLRGPAAELDRQGPALIRALREDPTVTTLSPWDRGSVVNLRPTPRRALILADFHNEIKEAVNETVPRLNRTLEEQIQAPVRATQTGFASISRALQERSIAASERGELLAFPFLLIVLLLVFRSPIAAAIPLGFGALTVISSRGILYLAASWFDIDAFALTVCSMMGLALGVDYALLMVSRFREELAAGLEPAEAARVTRRTAGRTTLFAGSTLLLSMLVSIFILPGSLLASLAGTLAMVVVLTVIISTVLAPAVLALLGHNVNRWRIGVAPNGRSRLMTAVSAALKRPALAALVIGVVVLLLAAPAIGLRTGPPSPEQLPQDDSARQDAELIAETTAPGYEAPYSIIAATDEGAITDPTYLDALDRFQHRLADLPGVQAVVGPGQVSKRVAPLQETGNALFASNGNIGPVKQLGRLGRNLGVAAGGVEQLRGGISEASAGAGLLAQGSGRASEGAQLIANGLGRATSGSQRAMTALGKFAKGAKRLSEAQEEAAIGGLQLKLAARDLGGPNLRVNGLNRSRKVEKSLEADANTTLPKLLAPAKVADEQLKAALAQLGGMTVGKGDPNYAAALEAVRRASAAVSGTDPATGAPYASEYTGLPAELEALQARLLEDVDNSKHVTSWLQSTLINLKKFANSAERLSEGLYRIQAGGKKLASGAERLNRAARNLGGGLTKLSSGAVALVAGIDRLSGGAEALEDGLAEAVDRSAPLASGLKRASVQVIAGKHRINRQTRRASRGSPNLFNSGYFVLSALDGTAPRTREAVATTIDLRHGGQAAAMLVISRYSFNTPGSIRLNQRLNEDAAALAEETGLTTGVAGGAAQLNDYSKVTRDTIPLVVAAITLVTFLVLVLVLRAVLLAVLAVALNLLTVGVAFGILTLLSNVPADLPLGGHEYIDAVGAVMIFGIVFGLSIDYAVFLLIRMREHYDIHGDNAAAIEFGLEKTARVITGAAVIMMAVFIAFAGSSLATVSQLGVGLTVAVILDATVVRIVLLPALMLLIGDRVWWLPRTLDRLMPKFDV